MRRTRRLALAALTLDLIAGLTGVTLLRGSHDAPAQAHRFVEAPDGTCTHLIGTAAGAWHYDGEADAGACARHPEDGVNVEFVSLTMAQ